VWGGRGGLLLALSITSLLTNLTQRNGTVALCEIQKYHFKFSTWTQSLRLGVFAELQCTSSCIDSDLESLLYCSAPQAVPGTLESDLESVLYCSAASELHDL
jgi:hypothetical protein